VPTPQVLAEHPRPFTSGTVSVAAGDVPGSRTPFVRADASGSTVLHDGRALAPDTVYQVEGRGRFYTDADGTVVRVETTSGGGAGVNPDLNRPLPSIEYVVNGDTVFRTDDLARTVEMDARGLTATGGTRSGSIQGSVGAEGRAQYPGTDPATGRPYDYEGGHLRGTQFDGPRERVNYVPMLEEVNNARSQLIDPVSGRNFGTLENDLASIIRTDPDVVVDFKVRPVYEGDSRVPVRIEVEYRIDGGDKIEEEFINVK